MWGNHDTFWQIVNNSLGKSVMVKKSNIKTENSAFTQFGGLDNISYIQFKMVPPESRKPELMQIAQKS